MKLPILLAVGFLACAVSAQDTPEKTTDSFYKHDPLLRCLVETKPHTLTAVRKSPDAYRGIPVEMEIVFHETRRVGNPFFTRFTADTYVCVAAWGAEQAVWQVEEFKNDFPQLFVDRETAPVLRVFLEAKPFDRIKVTVVVRDVFRGIPYLEIRKAELVEEGNIGEATILHASKGNKAAAAGDHATALQEYERAMRGNLPNDMKVALHADIAECYLRRGDRAGALAQLQRAKDLRPNDAALRTAYEKAIAPTPAGGTEMVTAKAAPPASRPAIEKTGTN